MKMWLAVPVLALAACSGGVERKEMSEVMTTGAWAVDEGADLDTAFRSGVKSALDGLSRDAALKQLAKVGYECQGESCTRTFEAQSCAMTWDISLPGGGKVSEPGATFKRDCNNDAHDYPTAFADAAPPQ